MARRPILYVKAYGDGRPTVCDLVVDDGQGIPPAHDRIDDDQIVAADLPYGPDLGSRVEAILRRHRLPLELAVVAVEHAERARGSGVELADKVRRLELIAALAQADGR